MARDSGVTVVARRDGVVESVDAARIVVKADVATAATDVATEVDIYNLIKFQRSNQNTCINQKPIVEAGRPGQEGRRHRRRPGHRDGRAGARPERARRLHALGRLQLRGLDPDLRAAGQGGHLHLGPHRGVRVRRPRHQARQGGDHPRHPQRRRGGPQGPRRVGHHPHRRRGEAGRHPGRQDHAQGRDPALARGEAAARHLRREGRRRARQLAARARRASRASSSTPRSSPQGHGEGRARQGRSRTRRRRKLLKDQNDEITIIQDSAFQKIRKLLAGKDVSGTPGRRQGQAAAHEGRRPHRRAARRTIPQRYWGEIAVGGRRTSQEKVREARRELRGAAASW